MPSAEPERAVTPLTMEALGTISFERLSAGFAEKPTMETLGAGLRCAHWPMSRLTDADKSRLYETTTRMACVTFGADVRAYWNEKVRTRYLDRLTFFGMVVDDRGEVVGWTGYHRIDAGGRRCMYIDSTGVLPPFQRSQIMGRLFGRLILRELARNRFRSLTIAMRTENPVVYRVFLRALGKENLYPALNGTNPPAIQAVGRDVASWLGQSSKFEPASLAIRGAYDNIDVMYGDELPACADPEVTALFQRTLRRQDAFIVLGSVGVFSAAAAVLSRRLRRIEATLMGRSSAAVASTPPAEASLASRHRRALYGVSTYFTEPLFLEQGRGTLVKDTSGRSYLDFFGGILTISLGHCEPRVLRAIETQLATLQHVSTLFGNVPMLELAERLASLFPGGLAARSFFTNSGTEAVEMAVLTARIHTGRRHVVALRHAYHGRSLLGMSLGGQGHWRLGGSEAPDVRHALTPYCYRCPLKLKFPQCDLACANDLDELFRTQTPAPGPAAFIAEPILGVGGFINPPAGYFRRVAEVVRSRGALFIADEVQTGCGRTGGRWWAIEHHDVIPDILVAAKGLGNGHPIGVTIARAEVADSFSGPSLSTFGGNPVSMAAASAVISTIQEDGLIDRAKLVGAHLRKGLTRLQEKHPQVGEVRGRGLMQGMELVTDRATKEAAAATTIAVVDLAREGGLLVGKGGIEGNVLRIAPPLTVTESEVDQAVEVLDRALTRASTV